MTKFPITLLALAAALAFPNAAHARQADSEAPNDGAHGHEAPIVRTRAWPAAALDAVARIPLQAEGRVKPLSTFADFKLLQLNGRRSMSWEVPHGSEVEKKKLSSVEWLLDCLFFPEQSLEVPCFLLDTYEVADAIGVPRGTKNKRDRWSYRELAPGADELAKAFDRMRRDPVKSEAKNRDAVEEGTFQLYGKTDEYLALLYFFEFARHDYPVGDDANARALFGGADRVSFADLIDRAPELARELRLLNDPNSDVDPARREPELTALTRLVGSVVEVCRNYSFGLCMIAPPGPAGGNVSGENPWLTVGDAVSRYFAGDERYAPQLGVAGALAQAYEVRGDVDALGAALVRVRDATVALAEGRGEYRKIESEVRFYKADLFTYALVFYILGFIGVAIGWMVRADHPIHRWLPRYMVLPLAIHVAGIVWRCYLRGRPPVSTLYETILFISGVAVLVSLVIERINRRRVAVGFAALIGAVGLFFAARYEVKEAFDNGADTMPKLRAVLDTNFWLSTHVTSVTIGYSAGLLAAFLAHIYIIGRLFGLKAKQVKSLGSSAVSIGVGVALRRPLFGLFRQLFRSAEKSEVSQRDVARNDEDFYRSIVRMVYGVLCFGLLFSVVGTILGGVWANDSWGRFWGWDPKENGALMICLCELAILHGRMGGYLRELGLCAAAVFNGTIVAFSWWHVNLLGVGLHAYGFTNGILGRLWIFYGAEALVLFAALYLWLERRAELKAARQDAMAPAKASPKPLPQGGT